MTHTKKNSLQYNIKKTTALTKIIKNCTKTHTGTTAESLFAWYWHVCYGMSIFITICGGGWCCMGELYFTSGNWQPNLGCLETTIYSVKVESFDLPSCPFTLIVSWCWQGSEFQAIDDTFHLGPSIHLFISNLFTCQKHNESQVESQLVNFYFLLSYTPFFISLFFSV